MPHDIAKLAAQREQLLAELSKLKEEIAALHGQTDEEPEPAPPEPAPVKRPARKAAKRLGH